MKKVLLQHLNLKKTPKLKPDFLFSIGFAAMKHLTAFLLLAFALNLRSTANTLFATAAALAGTDSTLPVIPKKFYEYKSALISISALTASRRPVKAVLGFSQKNRPIEVYYIPGTSTKKALVIGGVHGSELSAIGVVSQLAEALEKGTPPYYSVIVIPCLFPDNAALAAEHAHEIGSTKNIGRYTHDNMPDPNRQMPHLGKAYNPLQPLDVEQREIEAENKLLLQLIQEYHPDRIVNVHAIRNPLFAGIYADPRTDCNGIALGYETDSLLALQMARFIHKKGGNVKGNALDSKKPTTLYITDPAIAPKGAVQKRALTGSYLPNRRGTGVSLGAWASTAVCDAELNQYRNAIRVITIEFPGNKRPTDYTPAEQQEHQKQTQLYSAAIAQIFLGNHFTEDTPATQKPEQ